MSKLRSIQVLRGVAATAVVVHHAYRHINPNSEARIGAAGVDLFFVISGFIMVAVASGKRPGEFLFARFWRIFPLWWVAVIPILLVAPHSPASLVATLTLLPIIGGHYQTPALLQGWTLSFELLFYLAFAVALAWRKIVPLATFALAFCLSLFIQNDTLAFVGSPLIFEFMFGALIATLPPKPKLALPLSVVATAVLAIAPVGFYAEPFGTQALERVAWWGLPMAAIVYATSAAERPFESAAFALPLLIGDASYSIYLFHQFVVGMGSWETGVALSLCLGIFVHFVIEKPLIRLKPKLRRKQRKSFDCVI